MQIVSCGGSAEAYTTTGRNRFTVRQLLAPVEQTALLCNMTYLPPYVIYGTHRLDKKAITGAALGYVSFLHRLCSSEVLDFGQFKAMQHMNEWLNLETT
jgi:glutathione-regulated potassium-efflux system ancillary protein KefG